MAHWQYFRGKILEANNLIINHLVINSLKTNGLIVNCLRANSLIVNRSNSNIINLTILKTLPKSLALVVFCFLVAACSQIKVTDYKNNTPVLDMQSFFNGPLSAHGVVKNRAGKVIRQFNATIDASWVDGVGTLDEQFVFDDGEQQQRIWTLKPNGDGRYIATAGDVIGESDLQVSGNSLFLKYILQIAYGNGTINVAVDDRMYLVDPVTLMNESVMTKYGFKVGEVLLVIKKLNF